ncbi:MAG: hypothetical protein A3H69_00495 [Candidatus Sungbacteria bacterium RIFCSPLOWO2_02_FULL_47_9]|uniref:Pirin n=2 Tax=Parcubacteria group TaxID=1794811 RepID=A0A1G2RR56_9BACT|nr:MAG: hypothetical protein A2633_00690 [Candidatus Sungbacteria bacterium RIFCSPHIGHO2_01_FULL_47_32]OHA11457.1 MAG: hypothetical protein A3H69_00495 [Candidatus Sungbacteria bacterium RIFCSPLOWO2_02_FULL_47_9]OHA74938.1 MAG: hypothetical protein A3A32_03775 [Candidatus Wildermuthbacteria bacterium RIFCSPLOWO2_01_FULL_48_35]
MLEQRKVAKVLNTKATIEGAGVHLERAFGYEEAPLLDPFLLLDDFSSNNPRDYILGFPWHPHRGIETVTYMIDGTVSHEDSLGNKGVIASGDVQWMTAGSGIIHQEMPQEFDGAMRGFQLWVNLPARNKMMHPRYRGVKKEHIPVWKGKGAAVRIVAGSLENITGPVGDIVASPSYFDISLEAGVFWEFAVPKGHKALAYIFEGAVCFSENDAEIAGGHLVIFSDGDLVRAGGAHRERGGRFLLVSGKPIGEPIAWYGPIVMNTKKELEKAFKEYQSGSFIKHKIKK